MSAITDAAEALRAAVDAVDGVRPYTDLGATLDPPAVVVGPPRLLFDGMPGEATSAEFLVYVVVAADERAVERLLELVPVVAAALDEVTDVAVKRADPGSYPSGGSDLPAYEIYVEVSLNAA